MKAKKQQRKTQPPDATMQDVAQPKARSKSRPKRAKKAAAKEKGEFAPSAKAAKFKQEQHLQIDTQEFADGKTEEEKSDAPPSSTNKKRRRRSAFEIDRKFTCQVDGCLKAYGIESSLTHHQKLKHRDKLAEEAQENQVGAFLLPLHTASRNVTIRPATPLMTFASDPTLVLKSQSSDDISSSTHIIPPSAKAQRCNARFRSNSLPVASATSEVEKIDITPNSNPIRGKTPRVRAKTQRKPRRVATPHPKKAAIATRNSQSRSRSESLTELTPLQLLDECKIPPNHRSDSTASIHEAILPLSGGESLFEWPPSSISAAGHNSTSLSSDEQAIDSDILSVLANCDVEEMTGPAVLDFGPSYQSSADAEMLPVGIECFKIAEHSSLPTQGHEFPMNEPEAELGLNAFATLGDDWANALHLSTHLKKMSMTSPAHHLESAFAAPQESQRVVGRLRSASDPSYAASPMLFGMAHVSPMSGGNRSTQPVGNALLIPNEASFQSWANATGSTLEPVKVEDNTPRQMFWLSNEANVATADNTRPSSQVLDELLQVDDTLEWKTSNSFEGNAEIDYGLGDTTMTSALL